MDTTQILLTQQQWLELNVQLLGDMAAYFVGSAVIAACMAFVIFQVVSLFVEFMRSKFPWFDKIFRCPRCDGHGFVCKQCLRSPCRCGVSEDVVPRNGFCSCPTCGRSR